MKLKMGLTADDHFSCLGFDGVNQELGTHVPKQRPAKNTAKRMGFVSSGGGGNHHDMHHLGNTDPVIKIFVGSKRRVYMHATSIDRCASA